jgi:hypothetical protein
MRRLALCIVVLAAPAAASADPAPIGAHVACFHGKDKQPIQKRRAIIKDVTCSIEIDQGEPPPSAKATLALAQDGSAGAQRSSDAFVPHDHKDGIYYPFDPFALAGDFKACKDFTITGTITDAGKPLWKGAATVQTQCRAARKLPLQFGCHWDGDLVCVLQTRNLKTKIPAGVVGRVSLGGTPKTVQDAFADYPDDTYAVEARFAKADVPCTGASIDAVAENANGQTLYAQTITAPACPQGAAPAPAAQ